MLAIISTVVFHRKNCYNDAERDTLAIAEFLLIQYCLSCSAVYFGDVIGCGIMNSVTVDVHFTAPPLHF